MSTMLQVVASTRRDGRPCTSCGAALVWYRTKQGKPHPFNADVKPHEQTNLLGPPMYVLIDAKFSHFATCPNAAEHRKKEVRR